MSDATVDEAMVLTRRLAAGRLIAREELAAKLAELQAQRPLLEEDPLLPQLDARIAAVSAELAVVDAEYRSAMAEMNELRKLAGQASVLEARAVVASATGGDPVLRSLEENALDNARAHVAELVAQARLSDELRGDSPAAPPPKPTPEDADAQARAEFAALRARHEGKGDPKKTI